MGQAQAGLIRFVLSMRQVSLLVPDLRQHRARSATGACSKPEDSDPDCTLVREEPVIRASHPLPRSFFRHAPVKRLHSESLCDALSPPRLTPHLHAMCECTEPETR